MTVRQLVALLRELTPQRNGRTAVGIAVETLVAGLLEATVLVVIVGLALAIAEGAESVQSPLPIASAANWTPVTAVLVAAASALGMLAIHIDVSRRSAALAAQTLQITRTRVLQAFAGATWHRQSEEREGSIQETVSSLASQTAGTVSLLTNLLTAAVGLLALLGAAVVVDLVGTMVVVLFGGLLFLVLRPVARWTRSAARGWAVANLSFNESIGQWTSLAMEYRAFGVEGRELGRLTQESAAVAQALRRSRFVTRAGADVYKDLAVLFLVLAVGTLLLVDSLDFGAVGAVVLLIVRSLSYAQMSNSALQAINEASPNVELLLDRVHSLEASPERFGDRKVTAVSSVSFDRATYVYNDENRGILDVDLSISAGEALGVIGPSGGGKSTFVQMLLRLRPPTSGRVLLNDRSYLDLEKESWPDVVAFVPQEPRLFEGSIADNIRFLRPGITDAEVERAAAAAHLDADLAKLPLGLSTMLGPRGSGLSGGQRQRVSIARALVGRPRLLVLDEPTSALDVRSERLLQQTIERLKGDVTLVIVAHRLTTLACCDRIAAVNDGHLTVHSDMTEALKFVPFDDVTKSEGAR